MEAAKFLGEVYVLRSTSRGAVEIRNLLQITSRRCRVIHHLPSASELQVNSYAPVQFVFVHGMGGGAWFWFEMITLFQQIGFNTTAVDLTAHGINKAVADDVKTVAQYTKPLTDVLNNITGQVLLTLE